MKVYGLGEKHCCLLNRNVILLTANGQITKTDSSQKPAELKLTWILSVNENNLPCQQTKNNRMTIRPTWTSINTLLNY